MQATQFLLLLIGLFIILNVNNFVQVVKGNLKVHLATT